MTDTSQTGAPASIQAPKGTMFLYDKPEFLNREDHGSLGWRGIDNPFEFAAGARSVPLVASEISSAQKYYPVVFSSKENGVPLAVLSIMKDRNMFVDENGQWELGAYIPSYLRRHPFATAMSPDDQFAIVIDRASKAIVEDFETPFFDKDGLSKQTQTMIDFCGQFEAERRRTKEFSDKLSELGLLTEQQVRTNGGEQPQSIGSYFAVDVEKLNLLSSTELTDLHQAGYLSFIFAHMFSLENWGRLLNRRVKLIAEADARAGLE
ncbi:MAG: SapC family protein [Halieaceae bacterium]|jgi:hypothetical protein|nr:SapC family protein [Halieaceae bacterium]